MNYCTNNHLYNINITIHTLTQLCIATTIIVCCFFGYVHSGDAKVIRIYKNIYIPQVTLYTKNGEEVFLNTQQVPLSLLFFWEPWSCTSVDNIEKLYNLQSDFHNIPFQIILLSQTYNTNNLHNKDIINKFTLYFDPNRQLYNQLNIHTLPTAFLVNSTGKLLSKFTGNTNWNDDNIRNMFFEYFPKPFDKPKNNFIKNNHFVKHIK